MEQFYKITKEQAQILGRFYYEEHKAFDPFVSEQEDGTFLISQHMVDLLKEHNKFKLIDFVKCPIIEEKDLQTKQEFVTEDKGATLLRRMASAAGFSMDAKFEPYQDPIKSNTNKVSWWKRFVKWIKSCFN